MCVWLSSDGTIKTPTMDAMIWQERKQNTYTRKKVRKKKKKNLSSGVWRRNNEWPEDYSEMNNVASTSTSTPHPAKTDNHGSRLNSSFTLGHVCRHVRYAYEKNPTSYWRWRNCDVTVTRHRVVSMSVSYQDLEKVGCFDLLFFPASRDVQQSSLNVPLSDWCVQQLCCVSSYMVSVWFVVHL